MVVIKYKKSRIMTIIVVCKNYVNKGIDLNMLFLFVSYVYMYVSVCGFLHKNGEPSGPTRRCHIPEGGEANGFEPPDMGASS